MINNMIYSAPMLIFAIWFISLEIRLHKANKRDKETNKALDRCFVLVEENKKRNDLLVRVTTSHEHFIEDIKKKAEDFATRTRRNGVR